MRTFPLYDPKVYSLTMFPLPKGREKEVQTKVKEELSLLDGTKVEVTIKGDWCVLEALRDAATTSKDISDVSPEMLKYKYDELTAFRKKLQDRVQGFIKGVRCYHYMLITCGSRERTWLKTYSDMTFLFKEKNEDRPALLQSNISYLNRTLNRKGEVAVNLVQQGNLVSYLYVLGQPQVVSDRDLPRDMLLEVNISDLKVTTGYGDSPISLTSASPYGAEATPEKRLYQMRQMYLMNLLSLKGKLVDIFLLQSLLLEMRETEIKQTFQNGKDLNNKIFTLQNDINEHMKIYVPKEPGKKRDRKDFLDRESFNKEKELLTTASVRFSHVSEVEHQIMRLTSKLHDLRIKVGEVGSSISMNIESHGMEGRSSSIGELTLKEIDVDDRALSAMMEDLSHSRDILSSTIDVLRTFIDTRQREISEEMSRLMNVLFLVFACIGLADALGNFVIMAVQAVYLTDNPSISDVLTATSLGLIFTLLPLLIAVVFLVLFFTKKKKIL